MLDTRAEGVPDLIQIRGSQSAATEATNPAVGWRYFPPLTSQPQSITALWPVPNYTARSRRHTGVINLYRVVVTQSRPDRESNPRPLRCKHYAL